MPPPADHPASRRDFLHQTTGLAAGLGAAVASAADARADDARADDARVLFVADGGSVKALNYESESSRRYGQGLLRRARGVVVHGDELIVCHERHSLVWFDVSTGGVLRTAGDDSMAYLWGTLAVGDTNELYVSEYDTGRVLVFG
jgi:hypothetical protein